MPEIWKNYDSVVVTFNKDYNTYDFQDNRIYMEQVENNPEFWKRVNEDVTYEILKISDKSTSFSLSCLNGPLPYKNLDEALNNEFKISSVKRLSDGQVFNIGDKIYANFGQRITIEHMAIKTKSGSNDKSLYMWQVNYGGVFVENAEVYKPLFTSVDGVDIYKFDKFYVVNNRFFNLQETHGGQFQNEKWKNLRFANREKAVEFITENKPCLSVNDVEKIIKNKPVFDSPILPSLKSLVKEKSGL